MTSEQIGLSAGFVLALMGMVLFAVMLIAHKYIETIESNLPNCSYIKDNKRTWGNAGLLGKVMRGSIIAMILIMPSMHAKRGLIDAQEVSNLPKRYRYILTIPMITCCVLFVFLIALSLAEKYVA
ncbi:hypothetical protein N018_00835 [Pseudomonas syringae CC1557]|uniref:Uncharacterized protein n=1 Tax=Pseudomonas syringae CC1557 TaxID=1357279 RepID=W0MPW6_PSESX|nr:hypothetical protein [Pseudomonas syringae]AHG38866.1 hypothetical protein N018_00835 [Pseudomonas syringae CC1557]